MVEESPAPRLPIKIYFDHGDTGQDAGYEGSAMRFYEALLKKGLTKASVHYLKFRHADHSDVDWARRVDEPLRFIAGSGCSQRVSGESNFNSGSDGLDLPHSLHSVVKL